MDSTNLQRYHLAVVGAGSAGLASAALAAELGGRVALIERRRLGGDRLRYGVPAAALAQAARTLRTARRAQELFGGPRPAGADFAAVMDRARRLRADAGATADPARLRDLGVDVFFGEGRFVAADAVEVDGRRLRFRRAVIATGARMAVPRRPDLADIAYRTPDTLFELTALPRRLGVLGGGSRGCEMAQAFAAFGCKVHLFAPGERILPRRDADAAAIVTAAMRRDGVDLHPRSEILELRRRDAAFTVLAQGTPELAFDQLLLAAGPTANVEGLGLEAAGVEYDLSGVEVDRCLRTSNRRIFAAGGVVSPPGLAADTDARMAVRNALLFRRLERRRHTVTRATFTSPEIARVGIDAEQAAASPSRIETVTVPLADADRIGLFGEQGFLRLHLRRRGGRISGGLGGGRILGGTLVANQATELVGPLAMAVRERMRLSVFAEIPLPHPTRGEIYRRAAFAWRRRKTAASGLLGLWLELTSRL